MNHLFSIDRSGKRRSSLFTSTDAARHSLSLPFTKRALPRVLHHVGMLASSSLLILAAHDATAQTVVAKSALQIASGPASNGHATKKRAKAALSKATILSSSVSGPPPGSQYGYSNAGTPGTTGVAGVNGGVGGAGANPGGIDGQFGYTGTIAATAFGVVSTGGVGGTGVGGSDSSGGGGAGGDGGAITGGFTAGQVTGSSSSPTLLFTSTGGNGGVPGVMGNELGTPGKAGDGGAGGSITFAYTAGANSAVIASQGWNGNTAGATAIVLQSTGGSGGAPSSGAQSVGSVDGAAGGNGGNAGSITATLGAGSIQSQGSGLVAISQGGNGNAGTQGSGGLGKGSGGNGGVGGAGGDITLTFQDGASISAVGAPTAATGATVPIDQNGNVAQASSVVAAVLAQSLGGVGGVGGAASGLDAAAGAGGAAGGAGNVSLNPANGTVQVSTTGYSAPGVVLQSIGGSGGNGAQAGGAFGSHQGNGAAGGNGGTVSASLVDKTRGSGYIATTGPDSAALIEQSIGGGGGVGGSVQSGSALAGVTIGGNGESGGDGGVVTLYNGQAANNTIGYVIKTQGDSSSALVAQSIGGGGGTGGSAASVEVGAFNYVVGGQGGAGGDAGVPGANGATWVTAENNGIVSTSGNHSKGLVAQAVGGGGGDGGSAASFTSSTAFNINVAVGGVGGIGGDGGNVQGTNSQQILTSGSDSWGLLAQSVGGGGGNGGSAKAESWVIAPPSSPVPTVSIVVGVGGNGQKGGNGGDVTGTNNGLIMTSGAGAHGLMAQSIGGGGGNGGDSSTLNEMIGGGSSINVQVAIGGTGGDGGSSGNVTATNSAGSLIWTTGEGSRGILAQAISGGGGTAGTAQSDSDLLKKAGGQGTHYSVSLGGDGGGGGDSSTVTATNDGNILTQGNLGDGIFAQSVGGGGGLATSSHTTGAAGSNKHDMTLGGSSGTAADGGTVTATNNGNIVTRGGNANGILAQSVGGGGGKAGTPTVSGDAPATLSVQDFLNDYAASTLGYLYADNTVGFKPGVWAGMTAADLEQLARDYKAANAKVAPPTGTDPDTQDVTTNLNVGSGDTIPTGRVPNGSGGLVTVNNNGMIDTNGPLAAGIWAQSIGGGGGDGGTATVAATTSGVTTSHNGGISVGGQGFNSGNGGAVNVNQASQISTAGDASYGILAQSVGGGGGHAATTDSADSTTTGTLNVSLGGVGNVAGNGGAVNVQAVNNTGNATIATQGNDAIGIFAQSIGAGGGALVVMHTKETTDGTLEGSTNPSGSGAAVILTIGSSYVGPEGPKDPPSDLPTCNGQLVSSCGNGGAVTIAADVISTKGVDAHGILAQSIGGSGGTLIGAQPQQANPFVNRSTTLGNADAVTVSVNKSLTTHGDGAFGVLAQSIGGGGLLAGDLSNTALLSSGSFPTWNGNLDPTSKFLQGNGGAVTVNAENNSIIHTIGKNADAIFAQSIGGGGGLVNFVTGTYMGSLGGSGSAGPIAINVGQGALVQADGQYSSAIFTNSEGESGTDSQVTISNSGTITGNSSVPAIVLSGNGNDKGNGSVLNGGTIQNAGGTAIAVMGNGSNKLPSYAVVTNEGGATLIGDVQLGALGQLNNQGMWTPTSSSTVGQVNNNAPGSVNLGSVVSSTPTATLVGDLINTGNILTTVNFAAGTSSLLDVKGQALMNAGKIVVATTGGLTPKPVTVLIGESGMALGTGVTAVNAANQSVTYSITTQSYGDPAQGGGSIQVTPSTQFAAVGAKLGYSSSQASLGAHLDAGFTQTMSASMSRVYGKLASLDDAHLQGAMDSLGNEAVQAIGVARVAASQDFVTRMNSCPQFGPNGLQVREEDCVWTRAVGQQVRHDDSAASVGYGSDNYTVQVGGQKNIGNDWFLGGSFAYDHSNLSAEATSVSGGGWMAGIVLKKQLDDWIFSGAIDGGTGRYDSQRQATLGDSIQTATASFEETHVGMHARVARQIGMGDWYLKPYVDMHAVHMHTGAYSETGAGDLNLRVDAADGTSYGLSPMIETGSVFELHDGLRLHAYVSAGAAFYSHNAWTATASLQGSVPEAGTFTTTSELPNTRAKVNAGVDLITRKSLDMRVEYSGEFASGYHSNGATLKGTYAF